MSVFERLASSLGVQDETPNQELAQDIVETEDQGAVDELVSLLLVNSTEINNDSIKTLYEIGYVNPDLIRPYARDFLYHLKSANNRMVWGAMTALSTIARTEADRLFPFIEDITKVIRTGSVITVDAGIRVLAGIAAASKQYREQIFPILVQHILTCRDKDIPQHSEQILIAADPEYSPAIKEALEARMGELSESQRKRVDKVISQLP